METLLLIVTLLLHYNWILCDNDFYRHDQSYSHWVPHGRCLARCYDKYGRTPDVSVQDKMYDVYQANDCNSPACQKCKIGCNITKIANKSCYDICLPHGFDCQSSCKNLLEILNDTAVNNDTETTISVPTMTCQHKSDGQTVTVFLHWGVQGPIDTNIVFVVSMLREKATRTWKTLGQIKRSVVPIHALRYDTDYKFQVTAVDVRGIINLPKETTWIRTMAYNSSTESPSSVKIEGQKVHNGRISALVKWKSEKDPPCFYTLHWMTSNPQYEDYHRDEIKAPPYLRYWINNLHFGSNYTLHLTSYGNSSFKTGSSELVIWFVTTDCLTSTNYSYSICPPAKPRNVTGKIYLRSDNTTSCSVNVTWMPPYFANHNSGITYLVEWYKIIPIYMSKFIPPHQGSVVVDGNNPWVEIDDIHWDFNYSISIQAISEKGSSKPVVLIVTQDGCPQTTDKALSSTKETNSRLPLIIGGAAGVLFIVISLMLGIVIRNWRRKNYSSPNGRAEELNPLYSHGTDYVTHLVEDKSSEIEFSSLTLLDVIGEGAFGKVYKAVLNDSKISHEKDYIVAVKMLKDFYDGHEKKSLLMEIEFMRQLGSHPHIVSFVGCCKNDNICLLMDYCKLGDMRTFLLRYRQMLQKEDYRQLRLASETDSGVTSSAESTTSFIVHELQQSRLLSYARQIALAMEYMASRKFIHRDLAARNILMCDEERLKVSDFGLTRDIYERNLYQPTSARRLPYKWMALEAIFDQIFTIKSDVWSFGIVLWEIVTLGGSPYPGIPNKDLFNLLKEGYRMEKPENCTMDVYQLMLSAWHPNPHCRPSFTELRKKLEHMLEQTKPYINLSVSVSKDYYDTTSLSDQSDRNLHPNDHASYVEMSTKDSILTYETPLN